MLPTKKVNNVGLEGTSILFTFFANVSSLMRIVSSAVICRKALTCRGEANRGGAHCFAGNPARVCVCVFVCLFVLRQPQHQEAWRMEKEREKKVVVEVA